MVLKTLFIIFQTIIIKWSVLTLSGRGLYPIYGTLAKSQQVGCSIYSIPFLNKLFIIYIKGVKINDLSGPRITELLKKKKVIS